MLCLDRLARPLKATAATPLGTALRCAVLAALLSGAGQRKTPMKELFGVPKLKKDGTPGSLVELPPIDEIQTRPDMRLDFIKYSAYDAQVKARVPLTVFPFFPSFFSSFFHEGMEVFCHVVYHEPAQKHDVPGVRYLLLLGLPGANLPLTFTRRLREPKSCAMYVLNTQSLCIGFHFGRPLLPLR